MTLWSHQMPHLGMVTNPIPTRYHHLIHQEWKEATSGAHNRLRATRTILQKVNCKTLSATSPHSKTMEQHRWIRLRNLQARRAACGAWNHKSCTSTPQPSSRLRSGSEIRCYRNSHLAPSVSFAISRRSLRHFTRTIGDLWRYRRPKSFYLSLYAFVSVQQASA